MIRGMGKKGWGAIARESRFIPNQPSPPTAHRPPPTAHHPRDVLMAVHASRRPGASPIRSIRSSRAFITPSFNSVAVAQLGRSLTHTRRQCTQLRASSLTSVIEQLCQGQDLSEDLAKSTLIDLVQNASSPEQMAAFVVLLRAKGETPAEIAGMAKAMDEMSVRVDTPYDVGT